ncbi:MAG TPA: hypothetical protein VFE96_00250, partial [Candidatus Bathyarchaeia archaeon]|nr:hypothetical protein [Candidatus Bathyarchaeia archaeon]
MLCSNRLDALRLVIVKLIGGHALPIVRITKMPKQDVKQESKTGAASAGVVRPIGLSFSSFFYVASGLYYLIYPFVVQDTSLYQLFAIGALSILGSVGIRMVARWGLWLGLALFPLQIAAPAFALMAALQAPGVVSSASALAFIVSLAVLMFFASLTFLLVLDKRRTFK